MQLSTLTSVRRALSRHITSTSEFRGGPWEIRDDGGNMIGYVYSEGSGNTYYMYYMCTDNHDVPLDGATASVTPVEYTFVQTWSEVQSWTSKEKMEAGVKAAYPGETFTNFKCEESYATGW